MKFKPITASQLTEREKELILLISQGYNIEQIAQHFQVSVHRINAILTLLRHKLNVDTTAQAVGAAYFRGYVSSPLKEGF